MTDKFIPASESELQADYESALNRRHGNARERKSVWSAPSFTWRDPAAVPRREFIYGFYYSRGFLSATVADGGVGKTLLRLAECLANASGQNILGIKPKAQIPVLYWNGDDPFDEVERRIHALCKHYDIDGAKLFSKQWLFVGTRDKQPLCIGAMNGNKAVIDQKCVDDICAFIKDREIGLAAFDPFKATHRVPENDNTNMDAVAEAFSMIGVRTNAAVALDHHVRKAAFGQGEMTTADSRGAGAIINKARLSRVLNSMTAAQADQAHIKEKDRRRYFRADDGKGNIAPPGDAVWYKIVPVLCGNGQETPAVMPWKYPNAFDGITTDHMQRVRAMARDGNYRKDSQSEQWIGRAVAEVSGINCDEKRGKKQIREILKAWFENGVLTTKKRKDENRKDREFVVPGNWKDGDATP